MSHLRQETFWSKVIFFPPPVAFRGAVKPSTESYSACETALSRLRNRGPRQVPEPSEERLVIPAPRNSKFSNISQAARMHFPFEYLLALDLSYSCQKRGKPSEKRAGDALLVAAEVQVTAGGTGSKPQAGDGTWDLPWGSETAGHPGQKSRHSTEACSQRIKKH